MARSNPFAWLGTEFDRLDQQGLRRTRRMTEPLLGGRCRREGKTLWNFAGNDYLGLADHPRLIEAARAAIDEAGLGARASALVTGRTAWHAQLEDRLARFKGAESAILFPTGFAANVGTITALVGPEDAVFCDRLNHASLVDGCRLSRARLRVYPHGDTDALRRELGKAAQFRRRLIVTDSLFSMDGDHAPLAGLVQLAREFDAMLLVDEAHATGVFGSRGTGLLEELSETAEEAIAVGTLSKAIGLQGGFVTGSREITDWLWNTSRTQMYSTALSVPMCAAALAAIDCIEQEPERRRWLKRAWERLHENLQQHGWTLPNGCVGPIQPVLIGDPEKTMRLAEVLQARGILVAAIRPPTVPARTSRLRISLSYAHGEEGLDALMQAFQAISSGNM
jgi:8-amino-7-oxononanoate synthase